MKKILAALFTVMFFLGACGNQTDNETSDNNSNAQDQTEIDDNQEKGTEDSADSQSEDTEDVESEDEATDKENADQLDKEEDEAKSETADFTEYDVLKDEMDVDNYQADVKVDNAHKRVILFADDNGEKKYKSIYIKKKDR